MCGRFTLTASAESLKDFFPLFDLPDWTPRFNLAPTQSVLAVRSIEGLAQPRGELLRWGLIPFWAKEKSIGSRLINARAETVTEKPAFRAAFRRRRCLVLADGFYEWRTEGKKKHPFHIRFADQHPFAFAGLWERWEGEEPALQTCTLLTTEANSEVRPLHERMPVILHPRDYARWLDPNQHDPGVLRELLQPFAGEELQLFDGVEDLLQKK